MDRITAIAEKYGLRVIYDAAHAFAEKFRGVSVANFGDATMFSFHATKVFNTIEGGAVCFRDDALTQKLDDLKNFGIRGYQTVTAVGGNAKMSEFQAAMGICNLRHIGSEIEKRRLLSERYWDRLEGVPGLRVSRPRVGVESNYGYLPVVFDGHVISRDEAFERLADHGIEARKYFYPISNCFPCYRDLPTAGPEHTPVAAYTAEHVLTLPLHTELAALDVDNICDIILCRGGT